MPVSYTHLTLPTILLVFVGGIAVALDQIVEQLAVGRNVAVEIHAHKAAELQKSWIDPRITPG